jgi:hypothetical protein
MSALDQKQTWQVARSGEQKCPLGAKSGHRAASFKQFVVAQHENRLELVRETDSVPELSKI